MKTMTAKDLKNALLQEAVQGRLVPQCAADGNARTLLDAIRAEKQKSAKSKSSKPLPPIADDEIPFDIPDSWVWVRLGEIGITNTGSTPSKSNPEFFGNYIDFLSPGDIQNSNVTYGKQGLSKSGYDVARPTPKGTILQVCIGGSIGKCAIVDREVTFNQQINSITPIKVISEYVYIAISSDYFNKKIRDFATGTATPIINKSAWENLLIPLPPLAEQRRIVSAIEKLLPLIDEYGKKELVIDALNSTIGQTAKKAILQEAVQGRLVPQCAADGNARALLDAIRAEKQKSAKSKSSKPLPPIADDEIPFDIPDNWVWVRLGDYVEKVTDFVASGSFASLRQNVKYYNTENYAILVRTMDFRNDFKKDLIYTDEHGYNFLSNSNLFGGELILSNIGASIGKVFIVPKMNKPMTLAPNSVFVRTFDESHIKWLYYVFTSPFGYKSLLSISSASAQNKFNKTDFKNLLIPLPPLAEQRRIVSAIEKLLPMCERLGKE